MRRFTAAIAIVIALTISPLGPGAFAQRQSAPASSRPAPAAPKSGVVGCAAAARAASVAQRIAISGPKQARIPHGAPIQVTWKLPEVARSIPVFLVGAMPDTVRFEGRFQLDDNGSLQSGPGFVALPAKAQAPYGISFAEDRTRIIIPLHDPDISRSGELVIKPYAAGALSVEWAVAAVDTACRAGWGDKVAVKPVGRLGPFDIGSGSPQIVVQDFIAPDPTLELAAADGAQKLQEVEISSDGRYWLEVFPRRYRVFDRSSGAKLVDRAGVKPRLSPQARFVVASIGDVGRTYPTNLEVIDLVVGKVVAKLNGPIAGWANGDAMLLDATRAYQSVSLFNTLVDPVFSADGDVVSWPSFSPGCGTCDAWVNSNLALDWDRLSVMRADDGSARAMGHVGLASGRKVETSSFGDEEAQPLEAKLRAIYGRPDVPVPVGWTGNAPLVFTHVGRGYNGYIDDDEGGSLTPSEPGRRALSEFLAPRRLALTEGRVLRPEELQPSGLTRGTPEPARRRQTRGLPLDDANVAEDLGRFGLRMSAGEPITELPDPGERASGDHDPIIRSWPATLKAEVLDANPELQSWFAKDDQPDYFVAAWRIQADGVRYLLLQHGEAAMTVNGPHRLRFDLIALDGPAKGKLRSLDGLGGHYSQYVGRDYTVARVTIVGGKRLVVAVASMAKAEVVAIDGTSPAGLVDLQEPTVLCGFYEAAPRGLLVQSNCDGQLFVSEPHTQSRPLLSGRVVDNELILYTPEGFYASTYEGAHFVHVAFPGLPGVHSFEQLSKTLERPDIIAGRVAGKPLTVATPIISPPPQIEASFAIDDRRNIRVHAASAVGLAFVELYQDGRLVERRPATGSAATEVFKSPLPPHIRSVTLVAVDTNGIKSRPLALPVPATRDQRSNTLYVVAVGVDDYEKLPKLRGARFDAETFVAALRAGAPYYQAVRATLRVDREVTPQTVMSDVKAAVEAAGPDDTVLAFFAGHGGRTDDGHYFMATPSTDPDRMPETAIDWQRAADLLAKAKGRVIVVIDACHAGQTGAAAVANDGAVASLAGTAQAPMVVLAASKGRQESEEMPGAEGGVFTQTLARLLGAGRAAADVDRNGTLEVSELYRSLRQAVDAATSGRQTPWLVRRNIVGDAPLF